MRIAITGATGFLGRYLVRELSRQGHALRGWKRPKSDTSGLEEAAVEWVAGSLGDSPAAAELVDGCDGVVHAAIAAPGPTIPREGDACFYARENLLPTLALIQAARGAGVGRFVFISSRAVYDPSRRGAPLDETHPPFAASEYGAHKAAIEAFVHSYARGDGFAICALRPPRIYGLARNAQKSPWFDLVSAVVRGEPVSCQPSGREVHATDVARAVGLLLAAPARAIQCEVFNCYDTYFSDWQVATLAKRLASSASPIAGEQESTPPGQLATEKLRALGMTFGGMPLFEKAIEELVHAARS